MIHTIVQWLAVAAMVTGIYFLAGPWYALLLAGAVALITSALTERAQLDAQTLALARARRAGDE